MDDPPGETSAGKAVQLCNEYHDQSTTLGTGDVNATLLQFTRLIVRHGDRLGAYQPWVWSIRIGACGESS